MSEGNDIEKIIDRAEQLKEKKRKEDAKNRPGPARVKPRSVTPPDDERWEVHRVFSLSNVYWFRWLLPLGLVTLPVTLCAGKQLTTVQSWGFVALIAAIPIGRFAVAWIHTRVSFKRFRAWRSRLPFTLKGWEELVDSEQFTNGAYWRLEGRLHVELTPHPTVDEKAVNALLYIFCHEANREFYVPEFSIGGFSGDPRKEWAVNGTTAQGSVNNGVANQIYRFLDLQLGPLAVKYSLTGQVTITVSEKEYEIPPEAISSEGTAS
ncbi:MAG TPA: hypothetical protein PKN50_07430 [Spirochaetota bacterium]|nr:hypothetical protein [Spirochaetota bacterium]HPV41378.1 hypothetical protein [Spirochaetota bacterium]